MPRLPPIQVPSSEADLIEQEILILAESRKRGSSIKANKQHDPMLGATSEQAEASLRAMRRDIGAYGEYCFGWRPAKLHQLWNEVADDVIYRRVRQNKVLFIAPPGSAKSSWNSIVRPSYHLGNHPDQNIVFLTSSDPMATQFGSTVRSTLALSEKHAEVFPDRLCRPNKSRGWSSDGLYLMGTPTGVKDPAYRSVSYNATIMGSRLHGLIIDDPLDQKSAVSEPEQRRAKTYYDQTLVPRLHPGIGWIIAVMTRYHENDLASHLIQLADEAGDWIVIKTPLVATERDDPLGRDIGDIVWPERFSQEWVAAEMKRMTTAEFNLVHQGDPTGMGGDLFKAESWFQPLPSDFWSAIFPGCSLIQAWDLAFSEKKSACYTVGITAAIDRALNIYILNVVRKKMTIMETEDTMVRLIGLTRPLVVGIETEGFHQNLIRALARRVMSRVMCNIQLIRPDQDKRARALLPAARAEAGMLFVHKETPWARTYIAEHLGFPNTRYKDQVDTTSQIALLVERLGEMRSSQQIIHTEVVTG